MAASYITVGSGDHHVIALHGWFGSALGSSASRAMIVNYGCGNRLTPAFVDQIVRHSLDNASSAAFGAYLPSWARADILARVKGSEVPVKVITGEHGPTQPAEFMEQAWLQVYPNFELEVLRSRPPPG